MAEAFETKTTEETGRLLHSTDPGGLSAEEARKRLEQYGPNRLQEPEQPGFFSRLLSQFMDPLIYVLAAAGVISVFLGEIGDACIIAAVAALNGAVGMIQEGKAKRALDALKKMTRLKAVVRRDQTDQEIDAAELVPGDLVVLDAGRQVPADLRLLWTESLRAEESALTGEAAPVHKDAGFSAAAGLPVGDRKNMAYMSSNVTAGRGLGMVTATGMDTEIGRIARLIREAPMEATPLQKRLGDLGGALCGPFRSCRLAEAGCGRDAHYGHFPGSGGGARGASGGGDHRAGPVRVPDGPGPYHRAAAAVGGDSGGGECGLLR